MTATRSITQAGVNRTAYSGLGSTIVTWMFVVHVMGWLAGRYFEARIGFAPVWFLDCTGCMPRAGWLPSSWPVVGGMSVWLLLALGAASVLTVGKRIGMSSALFRGSGVVAAIAMGVFTVVALDTRFPGSLPPMLIGVAPAALATLAFSVAAAASRSDVITAEDPDPVAPRAIASVILGPLSMALLGGLISLVALYVSVTAHARAPNLRSRRAAVAGLITGFLSFIMRWNLSGRYGFLGLWV